MAESSRKDRAAAGSEAPPPQPWQMPPIAKVYEALSALSDGRVLLDSATHARVTSSAGDKVYDVEISPDGRTISANDNASYWQGYLGYPAIAVMLARGLYQPDPDVLKALGGIQWKKLNRRNRNNYDRAIAEVLAEAERAGYDPKRITSEAEAILQVLRSTAPLKGRRHKPAQVKLR
jgi:hypothetical protein